MCFSCLSTGRLFLQSKASREVTGYPTDFGVFGEGTNVSLLVQSGACFLPTCFHVDRWKAWRKVQLSEVNTGYIWTERMNLSHFPDRLIPLHPPHLLSNITGLYECTSPDLRISSVEKYRLEVIGKCNRFSLDELLRPISFNSPSCQV